MSANIPDTNLTKIVESKGYQNFVSQFEKQVILNRIKEGILKNNDEVIRKNSYRLNKLILIYG